MHVLIDGDIIGYRIGFSTEEENEKIVVSRVATFIESMLWEDLDAETYQGYLTGSGNFRNDIARGTTRHRQRDSEWIKDVITGR